MRDKAIIFPKFFTLYITFWFFEAPKKLLKNLLKFLAALGHFLSLTLMIKTFFRPWKNERRPGFYFYAIGIGAAVKFLLIIADLVILAAVLALGVVLILGFVSLPIIALALVFTSF